MWRRFSLPASTAVKNRVQKDEKTAASLKLTSGRCVP
jgi:hypothetical protein